MAMTYAKALADGAEGLLGLAHEALDQLAGRDELVDAADALAGRPELAVGVDVGGRRVAAEVVGAVLHATCTHLHRERLGDAARRRRRPSCSCSRSTRHVLPV